MHNDKGIPGRFSRICVVEHNFDYSIHVFSHETGLFGRAYATVMTLAATRFGLDRIKDELRVEDSDGDTSSSSALLIEVVSLLMRKFRVSSRRTHSRIAAL